LVVNFETELRPADARFFAFSPEVAASIRATDRFLVSYPRSGNTWVRCVLAACHLLQSGATPENPQDIYPLLEETIPDIHKGPLPEQPGLGRGQGWRLIKSHNLREVRGHRMVYLFRRPEVALVSYAHYAGRAQGGADRFVLRQLRTWAGEGELALAMLEAAPAASCFIAYEDLVADPSACVARLARHLELDFGTAEIEHALEVMNFRRMKDSERSGHRVEPSAGSFFRRGETALSSGDLRAESLEAVNRLAWPVYERLLAARAD
jgi:hypothetical protein